MIGKNVSFRLLTIADIPLLKDIMLDDAGVFNSQQIEIFINTAGNLAFGAMIEDKIIGLIYGYSLCQINDVRPQFFIYSMAIHSNFQNMGYGSRFFQFVIDWCRENNYAEAFVPTDKGNVRACRVYEKSGAKNDFENEIIYVVKYKQ